MDYFWLIDTKQKGRTTEMNRLDFGVVDAHQHIWHKADVPWLSSAPKPRIFGPYESIRRDYLIDEFKADSSVFNVEASIYMQANWAPARALDEARWVNSVGEKHGMPNALVAYANLRSPDLGDLLTEYRKLPRVVGVRHQIHWHSNSNYAYVPIPDMYDDLDWRRGLKLLTDRGFTFDLQVFPSQLKGATRMVREFPETTFILNHAGMLDSTDADTVALWEDGLADLAVNANVFCKLTGLGTFQRTSSVEHYRPIVATALRLFGPSRCIFGSNFPVEGMWVSYAEFGEHMLEALGPLSEADKRAIFRETALKAYRVTLNASSRKSEVEEQR
jgi:predicted TIM-barrel fold metal-dependent hydrolase